MSQDSGRKSSIASRSSKASLPPAESEILSEPLPETDTETDLKSEGSLKSKTSQSKSVGSEGKSVTTEKPEEAAKETPEATKSDAFDPKNYKKPTAVFFHENNDLSEGKGVQYTPEHAIPKHGPGVTSEIEQLYGPCTLLSDFQYTTWADTIVPLRNHNVVQGFNEMAFFLMKLAATGGENMSHEEAFLTTSFLSNIRNDLGEYPPNILSLLEHIDYKTREDGTPAHQTKFVYLG